MPEQSLSNQVGADLEYRCRHATEQPNASTENDPAASRMSQNPLRCEMPKEDNPPGGSGYAAGAHPWHAGPWSPESKRTAMAHLGTEYGTGFRSEAMGTGRHASDGLAGLATHAMTVDSKCRQTPC